MNKMSSQNRYVFVACGDDVHIETLHFSLRYLKHFSRFDIVVVTDRLRNNLEIEHNNVIDIETPAHLNNHEASIYLKTSLHKIVDLDFNYCYLDTDVIAIREGVDKIFSQQTGPISFASDHCNLQKFSPYAVNCGCLDKALEKQRQLEDLQEKYMPNSDSEGPDIKETTRELKGLFKNVYGHPFSNFPLIAKSLFVKYVSPSRYFQFTEKFRYDKQERVCLDDQDNIILYDTSMYFKKIEENSTFKFNRVTRQWMDESGKKIYNTECDHLREAIKSKFTVDISNGKWRHWSGGVFLFNKSSEDFLNAWHDSTMAILKDQAWKTRDQGTLALCTWKFNLQNQKRLDQEFNFIADYYDYSLQFDPKEGYSNQNTKASTSPYFIHVYHEFGSKGWSIWDSILDVLSEKPDPVETV